ncbi:hypothetical protein M513_05411 [Trichuris suis]|uniref:Uncharacterized protein n=1 Tax=Trichuris suis TaxID=68888 RepID=A0A085M910_9BILA|nr:hypothetical protein M513_05411 [Trichuris suis]
MNCVHYVNKLLGCLSATSLPWRISHSELRPGKVPESEQVPDGGEERFSHVRVSFRLPVAAAYLLRSLQSNEPDRLRSLGVLSVEVDSGNDTHGNPSCSPAALGHEGRNEDTVLANARSLPQTLDYNCSGSTFSPSTDVHDAVGNCFRPSAADMIPSTACPSSVPVGTQGRRRMSMDYQVLSPSDYQQVVAREAVDAPMGQYPRCRLRTFPLETHDVPPHANAWQCQQSTALSPRSLRTVPKRAGKSPTPATVSANSPLLVGLLLQSSGIGAGRSNPLVVDGLNPTADRMANSSVPAEADQGDVKDLTSVAALQKPKRSRNSGTRKGPEKRLRSKRDGTSTTALRSSVDGIPLVKVANANQRQVKVENETNVSSQYGGGTSSSCVSENSSSFSFATKLHRETTINEVIQSVVLNAPGQDGFVELLNPDNCDGEHYSLRIPDGGGTSKRLPSDPEDLNDCNLNPSSALSDGQSPLSVASTDNRVPTARFILQFIRLAVFSVAYCRLATSEYDGQSPSKLCSHMCPRDMFVLTGMCRVITFILRSAIRKMLLRAYLKRDCLTPHVVPYLSVVSVPNSVSYSDLCGAGNTFGDAESATKETDNAHLSPSGDLSMLSAQVPDASFCNLRRSLFSKSVSPVAQALANGNDRRTTELPEESGRQDDWASHSAAKDLQEDTADALTSPTLQSCQESNKWTQSNQTSEAAFMASDYLVRTDHDYAPLFDDSLNHASPRDLGEKPCGTLSDTTEEDCLIGKAALNAFERPYDQDGHQTLDVSVALLPQQVSSSQRQNHQWAMPTEMPFEQNVGSQ